MNTLFLVDYNTALINAWNNEFGDLKEVSVIRGDYFSIEADAMVSPANSLGIMDGGLDLAIRYELGEEIEKKVQSKIKDIYTDNKLPVGEAISIETENTKWPILIAAPTMEVPKDVSNTNNAYLAFKAILREVSHINKSDAKDKINTLLCPGLATGVGFMSPEDCATQMRKAFNELKK